MAVGTKYVVTIRHDVSLGPIIEAVDFRGSFSYQAPYTSKVVVQQADLDGPADVFDGWVVTYYWADAEGPDLGTVTVQTLLDDAVDDVNSAFPGAFP